MLMSDPRRVRRILRQHVRTDALLGVEAVPLGEAVAVPPLSSRKCAALQLVQEEVVACRKCELCASRTQTVFGEGSPAAAIMFVGEGPGQTEDEQGRPFVGRAGELLNNMITAMGLKREDVYIANVVKCRPPENRTPTPQESAACWNFLRQQIQIIQPQVIVALGSPAAKMLLNTTTGISALRGTWHELPGLGEGGASIPVMPTFHPAFLLRQYTPDNRKKVWSDLQKVMQRVGLK